MLQRWWIPRSSSASIARARSITSRILKFVFLLSHWLFFSCRPFPNSDIRSCEAFCSFSKARRCSSSSAVLSPGHVIGDFRYARVLSNVWVGFPSAHCNQNDRRRTRLSWETRTWNADMSLARRPKVRYIGQPNHAARIFRAHSVW